jgi:hypothetical protein
LGNNCHAHLWAKWNRTGGDADERTSYRRRLVQRSVSRMFRAIRRPRQSLRAISTVDALIALQGVEDPTERKKRAVAKGRNALDVLETLKLGLLEEA